MVTAVNLTCSGTDQAKKCRFYSWGSLRAQSGRTKVWKFRVDLMINNQYRLLHAALYMTQLSVYMRACARAGVLKMSVFMLWSFFNLKLWQIKHKLQVAVVPPIAWRQSQVNMATWRLWSNMIKTVTELRANRLHANGAEIHTKKKPTCSLKTWAGF